MNFRVRFIPLLFMMGLGALSASCTTAQAYWVPPHSPAHGKPIAAWISDSSIGTGGAGSALAVSAVQTLPASEIPPASQQTPTLSLDGLIDLAAVTAVPLPTATETPEPSPTAMPAPPEAPLLPPSPTPQPPDVNSVPILYTAQAADTLPVLAVRFGVEPQEIKAPEGVILPETSFLNPGQLLIIPRRLANTTSPRHLLPDSEVVYSPSSTDFSASVFAGEAGGMLSNFREWHRSTGFQSGGEIVMRVAAENSINPRLLLALLEYESGWVYGEPISADARDYPLGYKNPNEKGLYNQLVWAVNQLSVGYYAWREGRLTEINFPDGVTARMAPDLNAGTAALQYYFSKLNQGQDWLDALDPQQGFPALYERMYGSPWERSLAVEPLFPPGLTQPPLSLPFIRNWKWSYTGGPHGAWERDGAYAAIDFAPGSIQPGCVTSNTYVTASASGLVVRSGNGVVVLDLDGDGHEQTGWVLLYLHVSSDGRIPVGSWVDQGDPLGHPSCEGGISTGTHVHIARKYNGEWVPASGPLPFNLGGWVVQAGDAAYKGTLTRDGQVITACTCSSAATVIIRTDDDP